MELTDYLTIIGALGGWEAIKWCVNFFFNRKLNRRKDIASVDSLEIDNQKKQVDWLEERLLQRDTKIDSLYIELRQLQSEKMKIIYDKHSLELKLQEAIIRRCDIRGCKSRQPPSDY